MKQTDQTKVAMYCRTAQSNYWGIKNQIDRLKTYADKQGFSNVEFFIDDGFNGLDFNRPEFQKIIREIEAGNVNTVVACDLDRYGRNCYELYRVLGELHDRYGVRFLTVFGDEFPDDRMPDWIQGVIDAHRPEKGGTAK